MTGTSINPLLRAAYLAIDRPPGKVTLMVPWLEMTDQNFTYPPSVRFNDPSEQERYVRDWLVKQVSKYLRVFKPCHFSSITQDINEFQANLPIAAERLDIRFYAGRYHDEFNSIFAMGDITDLIPDNEADFCVLEEPEHLNWYRAPFTTKAWTEKFRHVVGIMHTNYLVYARTISAGFIKEPFLYVVNKAMCRAYCHKVIKLSNALQEFASEKEITCNVHGVREHYLKIGDSAVAMGFSKGAYFVGKLIWPKGLDKLFALMKKMKARTGRAFPVDIFGHGPHAEEIKEAAARADIDTYFHGGRDHAQLTEYKVFVNPSISEVLCTTIVEALAMGKWVVCAKHPSNEFFEQFPNCLLFRTPEEFAANVIWALSNDPTPLTPEQRYTLSWEAATERLIQVSAMTEDEYEKSHQLSDKFSLWLHNTVGAGAHGDFIRNVAGISLL